MNAPLEARCDRCTQLRPLFRFLPEHGHFGGSFYTCRWCTQTEPLLLCVRCTDLERADEAADPAIKAEYEAIASICEANRRSTR